MGECCLEGFLKFVPGTELEGGSKEERKLEEEDRGGHTSKTGRRATEDFLKQHYPFGLGSEELVCFLRGRIYF
jgi:hypothetical protein